MSKGIYWSGFVQAGIQLVQKQLSPDGRQDCKAGSLSWSWAGRVGILNSQVLIPAKECFSQSTRRDVHPNPHCLFVSDTLRMPRFPFVYRLKTEKLT